MSENPTQPYQATEEEPEQAPWESNLPPLPEAAGVVWTDMLTSQGQKVNLTSRATSLITAIDELNKAVLYAHEKYGWNTVANVTRPTGAAKRREASQGAPQRAPVQTPTNEVPGETGQSIIAQYQVSRTPEGTGELLLYEAGHKYPDFRVVGWSIENLAKLLSNVGTASGRPWEDAINQTEQGMVQWLVTWQYSEKLNTKGNPYKNVKAIAPYNPA